MDIKKEKEDVNYSEGKLGTLAEVRVGSWSVTARMDILQ